MGGEGYAKQQARSELSGLLRDRRQEIEDALYNRVTSLGDLESIFDPEYLDGLRQSVITGFQYALDEIDRPSSDQLRPVPVAVCTQARLAAQHAIPFEIVLRRLAAYKTLLFDFIATNAVQAKSVQELDLAGLFRAQGALFDKLISDVSDAYRDERKRLVSSRTDRLTAIRGLLAGELVDTHNLNYDFDAIHIAVIAIGSDAIRNVKELAGTLDCSSLIIPRENKELWAWLGRREPVDPKKLRQLIDMRLPTSTRLSIGTPAPGLTGWRKTYRQAAAAFPLARKQPGKLVSYGENPLLIAALRDDLLRSSLYELYLKPLATERDDGQVLKTTLRAYFNAGQNGASAAAALDISRQTVRYRLQQAEERIGCPLSNCMAALVAALQVESVYSSIN